MKMRVTTPQEPFPPSVGPTSPQPHRNHYTYSLLFLSILFILGFGWPHHTRSIPSPRPHSSFCFLPSFATFHLLLLLSSFHLGSPQPNTLAQVLGSSFKGSTNYYTRKFQASSRSISRIIKSMSYCFFFMYHIFWYLWNQ